MICPKCNAQIADGAAFCSSCGANLSNAYAQTESTVVYADNQQYAENQATVSAQQYAENQEHVSTNQYYENQASSDFVKQPTMQHEADVSFNPAYVASQGSPAAKKTLNKIIAAVAAVLVVLIAVGTVFGKTILFATSPDVYVGNLVKSTLGDIADETDEITENIFGFEINADEDLTVGAKVAYKTGDTNDEVEFAVSDVPSKKKLMFEGKMNIESISDETLEVQGFWDDKNIGVLLPGSDSKYLSVPSKTFGKDLEESNGIIKEGYDEIKDSDDNEFGKLLKELDMEELDLSYSNIRKNLMGDTKANKNAEKYLTKNILALLDKSDIGKRESVKFEFGEDTVNAKEIAVTMESDDVIDCVKDIFKDCKSDEEISENIDKSVFEDTIDALDDLKDQFENRDVDVTITEYKGRIVGVCFEAEVSGAYFKITVNTTDKKHLLCGAEVTAEVKGVDDDSENQKVTIGYTSNWLHDDKKITIDLYGHADGSEEEIKGNITLDFKKEKWEVFFAVDDEKFEYEGVCSKKDGFTFKADYDWTESGYGNSMSYDDWQSYGYDEWLEEKYNECKDDYLEYIYENKEDYYYDFDTYEDWYAEHGSEWEEDTDAFETWLLDEEYYLYDDEEIYNNATETEVDEECKISVEITFKNKVTIKLKDGKNENILNWSEEDFESFAEDFADAVND